MASLQIPEHLDDELTIAAECSGQTKEALAAEILAAHFRDESLPLSAFTEAQLTRFKESVEQAKRGELIPEEEIDKLFEDWFKRLDGQ
jgi:predicted transcriptional regulator